MSKTVEGSRGLWHAIIHGAAERASQLQCVNAENREAFRQQLVLVLEQQVCAVIGADTVTLSGWTMPPSERRNRRARIVQALRDGDAPRAIASRELISERWVWKLRAEIKKGDEA